MKIVVKIGTQLITNEQGLLNHSFIEDIVRQIVLLKKQNHDVILVSSGAMGAGRGLIQPPETMNKVVQRQILSSIGQVKMIEAYSTALQKKGYHCCQVLTCKEDFRDRHHYLNMKNCFSALLHENILPIVNENDVIAIDELMFTDNDELSGLIGAMMDVDAVLILTSVDGIFDKHPNDPDAQILDELDSDHQLVKYISKEKTQYGRGGMHTKARVATKLASMGITTHIANGNTEDIVVRIVNGEKIGTRIIPKKRLSSMKKWIAHTDGIKKGKVTINACAEEILTSSSIARSLLPVGITKIIGPFAKGDIVTIENEKGEVLGLGIAQYNSETAEKYLGKKSKPPFMRYDYLYIGKV